MSEDLLEILITLESDLIKNWNWQINIINSDDNVINFEFITDCPKNGYTYFNNEKLLNSQVIISGKKSNMDIIRNKIYSHYEEVSIIEKENGFKINWENVYDKNYSHYTPETLFFKEKKMS